MGAPYFQYKKILEDYNVKVFSSNFTLYSDISSRMMTIIESLVPRIEIYSIDEAFMDFSGIKDIEKFATHIRHTLWHSLGMPTSIGIAKTKTLAKVANSFAKRIPTFKSICFLHNEQRADEALKRLAVSDVWGIGRQTTKKLEGQGILTAFDLKQVDPRCMRQNFTVVGERIVRELNGISCLKLEDIADPRKSIQVTRSFAKPITEFETLKSVIATYATRLGQKLREQHLSARDIVIFIRTNKHKPNDPQYSNSVAVKLAAAVQDDVSLIKASAKALFQIYRKGFAYSKAGIMAIDLVPKGQNVQLDLFSRNNDQAYQSPQLWEALDRINQRYGQGTIHAVACGKILRWRDQKNNLSPAYTANWDELPIVFAK